MNGNNGLITDIKCIEKTSIIITIDDKFIIKVIKIKIDLGYKII